MPLDSQEFGSAPSRTLEFAAVSGFCAFVALLIAGAGIALGALLGVASGVAIATLAQKLSARESRPTRVTRPHPKETAYFGIPATASSNDDHLTGKLRAALVELETLGLERDRAHARAAARERLLREITSLVTPRINRVEAALVEAMAGGERVERRGAISVGLSELRAASNLLRDMLAVAGESPVDPLRGPAKCDLRQTIARVDGLQSTVATEAPSVVTLEGTHLSGFLERLVAHSKRAGSEPRLQVASTPQRADLHLLRLNYCGAIPADPSFATSVRDADPLAVVAQQFEQPEGMIDLALAIKAAGRMGARCHLELAADGEPQLVAELLIGAAADRRAAVRPVTLQEIGVSR